jgi:hypothetical protein
MITIFTTPKPFKNLNAIIQRNAIRSWTLLEPKPEIILFGNDEGVEEIAEEFSLLHIPDVQCNEYGTPLLNDLFARAEAVSTQKLLCYINADIILLKNFAEAASSVSNRAGSFLMIGQRWDIEISEEIQFDQNWHERLLDQVKGSGVLHPPTGTDYFLYPKNIWTGGIPPFTIGRGAWDAWLVYRARTLGLHVIDATEVVTAIHQNHDYSHLPASMPDVWKGPEALENLELAGGYDLLCTIEDATHRLVDGEVKLKIGWKDVHRRLKKFPVLHPEHRFLSRIVRRIV